MVARRARAGDAILFVGQSVSSSSSQVRGFIIAELITGAALIALVALGGEWLIGRGLEPLDEMARTANDITSRGDLTARMPDADDQTEVGRLGSSINTMLDRIQQAFSSRLRSEQKVREFAADASHELRTPLTTIRGYAELYRQGALGPEQLPNAMRRIEQEAERMSNLVAELLELARLDRTSSLDLTETDLAGVVRDAVADAIAVEPQRPVAGGGAAPAGRGRGRGAHPAGAGEPAGQRPRAHSGRPRRWPCGWARSPAACSSRWLTPAPACPRRTPSGHSTGSTGPARAPTVPLRPGAPGPERGRPGKLPGPRPRPSSAVRTAAPDRAG